MGNGRHQQGDGADGATAMPLAVAGAECGGVRGRWYPVSHSEAAGYCGAPLLRGGGVTMLDTVKQPYGGTLASYVAAGGETREKGVCPPRKSGVTQRGGLHQKRRRRRRQ